MAGILRIPWQQETLRSLWIMYQAYLLDSWDHTSSMLCAWAGKKTEPFRFHPYRTAKTNKITPKNITALGQFL